MVNLSVQLVGENVRVDTERTGHLNIVSRHCSRNLTPTGECVSLLSEVLQSGDSSCVVQRINMVNLSVQLVGKNVGVNTEQSCYLYIVSRHRSWNLAPSWECVAFLNRIWSRSQCAAINYAIRTNNYIIYLVGQQVTVDREVAGDNHIMSGHCVRYLTPSAECVAFLNRIWSWCQCAAICYAIRTNN